MRNNLNEAISTYDSCVLLTPSALSISKWSNGNVLLSAASLK
jgi:hypothetical protein